MVLLLKLVNLLKPLSKPRGFWSFWRKPPPVHHHWPCSGQNVKVQHQNLSKPGDSEQKMSEMSLILVKTVVSQSVRFVGDILRKTGYFRVLTINYHNFTEICQKTWGFLTLLKRWKTVVNSGVMGNTLKLTLFVKNHENGKIVIFPTKTRPDSRKTSVLTRPFLVNKSGQFLTQMVCRVTHCIRKKPGEPPTARWDDAVVHVSAGQCCGTVGGYPGYGGVRGRSTGGGHPWYGSGSGIYHCYKEFTTVLGNFRNFREFSVLWKFP